MRIGLTDISTQECLRSAMKEDHPTVVICAEAPVPQHPIRPNVAVPLTALEMQEARPYAGHPELSNITLCVVQAAPRSLQLADLLLGSIPRVKMVISILKGGPGDLTLEECRKYEPVTLSKESMAREYPQIQRWAGFDQLPPRYDKATYCPHATNGASREGSRLGVVYMP